MYERLLYIYLQETSYWVEICENSDRWNLSLSILQVAFKQSAEKEIPSSSG
jgi:hypothetical protein